MNTIDYMFSDNTLFISITTNYMNETWRRNKLLSLSIEETQFLVNRLTQNLEWSKHPLYQWGQKKIGNI